MLAGTHDRTVTEGGIAADHDLTGRARSTGHTDGVGDHRCRAPSGAGPAGAEPDPGDHGAPVGVDKIVANGDSPLRRTCFPAILVWP